MMFRMRLAGLVVEVHSLYEEVRTLCKAYLLPDGDRTAPDITVVITPADIEREREATRAEERKTGIAADYPPETLESTAVHRKTAEAMAAFGILVMHGAVIATDRLGYMITAPSGTGKTTRLSLWADHIPGTVIVNGDKPMIRVSDDDVLVFGTPWCGKEGWNTDISVPLRAIFLLERADDKEDEVRRISFGEAFPALLRQSFLPANASARVEALRLLRKLGAKIPVYRFRSRPTEDSVRLAWETARSDSAFPVVRRTKE
ncbi:MAG: hypothetical protein IKP10_03290 [Clostridia bacterium]|nr:hypothetical protein [Clostridia bacterium]